MLSVTCMYLVPIGKFDEHHALSNPLVFKLSLQNRAIDNASAPGYIGAESPHTHLTVLIREIKQL